MTENILIPIVIDKYIPDVTNRLLKKIIDSKIKKIALIGFSENMRWLNRLLIEHNISPILNDWRPKYFGYDCGKNKINWYGLKDDRSYFVSYKKMKKLSFKCKYDLEYGITELKKAYKKGKLFKSPETISISWFDELIKWEKIINNVKMYNGVLKIK